jgi:hypothetical protein
MAKVIEPLSDAELKKIAVANLRDEYRKLSNIYMRIMNEELIYCPHCGTWKNTNSFYSSNESPDGIEHYACKECILNMMTDYDSRSKIRTDNKEKTIAVFKKLNWYFNEKLYNDQITSIAEGTNEKLRSTGAQQLLTIVKSLKQYRDKTYADSEFDIESVESDSNQEDVKIVQKTLKNAKKRFGSDYTNEQLMYLEQEYQDWITRYECNTKAQEEIFKNLSGEYPVLILDDVMSELDLPRRKKLLSKVKEMQTILTCTHAERVLYGADCKKIRIEKGKIKGEGK